MSNYKRIEGLQKKWAELYREALEDPDSVSDAEFHKRGEKQEEFSWKLYQETLKEKGVE